MLAPPDPRTVRAKKREIARRYTWKARQRDKRLGITVHARVRMCEIARVFASRYGKTLPDDTVGRDDLYIAAQHVGSICGDIVAWASLWAPVVQHVRGRGACRSRDRQTTTVPRRHSGAGS